MNCVFCSIISGDLPVTKVFESEHMLAFEDIAKVAPVHCVIVPKRHIDSVLAMAPSDTELLTALQTAIQEVAKITGVAETGFRIISNCGAAAGQTVFHLHYHLIGGRELAVTLG